MIIPFIIAYFATGLLFVSCMILFALFVIHFYPDKCNELNDYYWSELEKDTKGVEQVTILGQKVNRKNWARLTFITWCIEMFFFWPREIYKFCMKRR